MVYDAVIAGAGAGPVGLFLACELRLADLAVTRLPIARRLPRIRRSSLAGLADISPEFSSTSTMSTPRRGDFACRVRPDGFVAWAGEGAPNLEELDQAASQWFGEPGGPS